LIDLSRVKFTQLQILYVDLYNVHLPSILLVCRHHVYGDPNFLPDRARFLGHPEAGLCAVGGVTGDEVAHESGVVPTSFLNAIIAVAGILMDVNVVSCG